MSGNNNGTHNNPRKAAEEMIAEQNQENLKNLQRRTKRQFGPTQTDDEQDISRPSPEMAREYALNYAFQGTDGVDTSSYDSVATQMGNNHLLAILQGNNPVQHNGFLLMAEFVKCAVSIKHNKCVNNGTELPFGDLVKNGIDNKKLKKDLRKYLIKLRKSGLVTDFEVPDLEAIDDKLLHFLENITGNLIDNIEIKLNARNEILIDYQIQQEKLQSEFQFKFYHTCLVEALGQSFGFELKSLNVPPKPKPEPEKAAPPPPPEPEYNNEQRAAFKTFHEHLMQINLSNAQEGPNLNPIAFENAFSTFNEHVTTDEDKIYLDQLWPSDQSLPSNQTVKLLSMFVQKYQSKAKAIFQGQNPNWDNKRTYEKIFQSINLAWHQIPEDQKYPKPDINFDDIPPPPPLPPPHL